MKNFIISVLVNFFALFIIVKLLDGIAIDGWHTMAVAAIVLTFIHTFLKPVIIFISLPFNILSLGILTLFINAGLFYFASKLVTGFKVTTFWYAFLAALILSVITVIIDAYVIKKNVRVLKHYGNTPPNPDIYNNNDN